MSTSQFRVLVDATVVTHMASMDTVTLVTQHVQILMENVEGQAATASI